MEINQSMMSYWRTLSSEPVKLLDSIIEHGKISSEFAALLDSVAQQFEALEDELGGVPCLMYKVAITVAIESGCPVLLRQTLTPFVYAVLFAVLSAAFVDLAWERKSLSGVVGLGYVLREMLLQVDYVAPMTRSRHPS